MAYRKRNCETNPRCTNVFLQKFAFRDQYGFIKDARQETITDFTAINAVSSSDNETSDTELDKINTQLSEILRAIELRKRAYYVNMPNHVYVIGGYLSDPIRKERRAPPNDWRWDIEGEKLEKIAPIPGHGRINFGIAANNGKIVLIGGNTIANQPTNTCFMRGENEDQWEMLPSLPNPLCGSAVTLDDKDTVYIFGGYDLLSGDAQFRNDFLRLDKLTSKEWTKLKTTLNSNGKHQSVSPRARALLVTCDEDAIPPDGGLFACGGYHKSSTGELQPIPEILSYNKATNDWNHLSNIPDLNRSDIFAVDNNILIISNKIKSDNVDDEDEIVPRAKFDLINRQWLMIGGKEIEPIINRDQFHTPIPPTSSFPELSGNTQQQQKT